MMGAEDDGLWLLIKLVGDSRTLARMSIREMAMHSAREEQGWEVEHAAG